jgi:hypothetical protein
VFDVTTDIYFWFFGGLLLTVMKLDRAIPPPVDRTFPAVPRRRPMPAMPPIPALAGPNRASLR